MTKYHYTCPIKAAYMAEYFGVEMSYLFCNADSWQEYKSDERMGAFKIEDYFSESRATLDGRIWVDEEWNSFFQPRKSDIVFYKDNLGLWLGDSVRKHWAKEGIGELYDYQYNMIQEKVEKSLVKIIMRDGKQFFMPEVEND